MKRVLIACVLFFACTSAESYSTVLFPPLQPLRPLQPADINNSASNLTNNPANTSDMLINQTNNKFSYISQIEQKLFGRTYSGQNISARLSRLEKNLFSTTYPDSTNEQRIDNIISNFNQISKYPNISQNGLSKIEAKVFKQIFPQNTVQRRIERLEQQMLGAVQNGNIDERYNVLLLAEKNYNKNAYNNNIDAIESYNMNTVNPNFNTQSGWKGLLTNFSNPFWGGSMTGFTPPVTPGYNNYNNYYNYPNNYGSYRGYRTNRGYMDNFHSYTSGTGVTILD